MESLRTLSRAALWSIAGQFLVAAAAAGPYVTGDRFFPPTPTTEDPFVADVLSMSANQLTQRATDEDPATRETEIGFEIEKRLTENLGISVEDHYLILDPEGEQSLHGFDNVEAGLKYQVYENDEHEALVSVGVVHEFGDTGSRHVDAEKIGTTTPTFYFGKGFGDLPDSLKYLRPLAVTGTFGYQVADWNDPDFLVAGVALEYNLKYLQGNVEYLGLPTFIGRLTPVVEFAYATPADSSGDTTEILAPGLVYSDIDFNVGAEALIPLNRATGTGTGFVVKLSLFFDGLMPNSVGKPVFGD